MSRRAKRTAAEGTDAGGTRTKGYTWSVISPGDLTEDVARRLSFHTETAGVDPADADSEGDAAEPGEGSENEDDEDVAAVTDWYGDSEDARCDAAKSQLLEDSNPDEARWCDSEKLLQGRREAGDMTAALRDLLQNEEGAKTSDGGEEGNGEESDLAEMHFVLRSTREDSHMSDDVEHLLGVVPAKEDVALLEITKKHMADSADARIDPLPTPALRTHPLTHTYFTLCARSRKIQCSEASTTRGRRRKS